MTKKEVTYSALIVNILAFILIIPMYHGMVGLYTYFNPIEDMRFGGAFIKAFSEMNTLSLVLYGLSFVQGVIIHEFLHGITFAKYTSNGLKDVKFGFNTKAFAPYAHCKKPLHRNQYILALIMPLILLGIIPALIGVYLSNLLLFVWALAFTLMAIGDLLILSRLVFIPANAVVSDHPTKVGFVLHEE